MRVLVFTHSLLSCWNHGNAHFLRGVLRALIARGHDAVAYEPSDGWSLANLLADHGETGLNAFRSAYPELASTPYRTAREAAEACHGADLVVVHEWNDPAVVAAIGRERARGGRFTLLFHDTHHRAVSDPAAIHAFDLSGYDGVLAFGETLAQVYRRWGWGRRAFVWHEAADTTLFHPPVEEHERSGLVWIGNWGDEERSAELREFLIGPAHAAGLPLDVYGVRYPREAVTALERSGARYHGWLPNAKAPQVYAAHLATAHVPRRFYVRALPGIPTIRVFEALACGIPLVCAPWDDRERLFRPGDDYLVARDGAAMTAALSSLRDAPDLRAALVRNGLETIRGRHTCDHRVDELLAIVERLGGGERREVA
jgi:spore maturation protein CgeB